MCFRPSGWPRWVLIAATLGGSWLGMQAVHELGHVLACWATGGRVVRVVLSPQTISRTDCTESRAPLLVVASGPVFGALLPLMLAAAARRATWGFVVRFFAGFSLIANGCYVAFGSLAAVGDSGELLRLGAPAWALWLFGLLTAPLGLWLWHGQGRHFGVGPRREPVSARVACGALVISLLLLAAAVVIGGA